MSRGLKAAGGLALGLAACLAGCASPRENAYTLESAAPPAPVPAPDQRTTVAVGPVSVPELVDRPQLVVRDGRFGVAIVEQERWAAPLKESLPRVFAAELGRRRPEHRFVAQSAATLEPAAARLALDLTSFDVSPQDGAVIVAHWSYRAAGKPPRVLSGDLSAHASVTGPGYAACVEALHRASEDLADQLAAGLPTD
jgi:uncharacterized lipoprotein YmbA